MVRQGFTAEAQAFRELFGSIGNSDELMELHREELQSLATLTTQEQLDSEDFLLSNPFM